VADDLSELLEALNLTGPVDVIGAALGSLAGASLAIRHPDRVRRLIMCAVAPGARPPGRAGGSSHLTRPWREQHSNLRSLPTLLPAPSRYGPAETPGGLGRHVCYGGTKGSTRFPPAGSPVRTGPAPTLAAQEPCVDRAT
jgi:pimeloyl-ACP methyl ester carboxylesterase